MHVLSRLEAKRFIKESNLIEGITRSPHGAEINAFIKFVHLENMTVESVEQYVRFIQPGAVLRINGQTCTVGRHVPPAGGMTIYYALQELLERMNKGYVLPAEAHCAYETLHPFTDGNGRSGRALWVWQNIKAGDYAFVQRGFLHEWYYRSLDNWREK
jgi:hypothetical protein